MQNGSKLLAGNSIDSITKKSIQNSLGIIKDHTGDATISNKLQVQSITNINKFYSKCDNELKQEVLENVKISAEKLIAKIISKEEYRTQASFCFLYSGLNFRSRIFLIFYIQ